MDLSSTTELAAEYAGYGPGKTEHSLGTQHGIHLGITGCTRLLLRAESAGILTTDQAMQLTSMFDKFCNDIAEARKQQ